MERMEEAEDVAIREIMTVLFHIAHSIGVHLFYGHCRLALKFSQLRKRLPTQYPIRPNNRSHPAHRALHHPPPRRAPAAASNVLLMDNGKVAVQGSPLSNLSPPQTSLPSTTAPCKSPNPPAASTPRSTRLHGPPSSNAGSSGRIRCAQIGWRQVERLMLAS